MNRIRAEKIDLRVEQNLPYRKRTLPPTTCWARSAYRVLLDGVHVADLTYSGGWGRGKWRTTSLHYLVEKTVREDPATGRRPNELLRWLDEIYHPRRYPDRATLERERDVEEVTLEKRLEESRQKLRERRRKATEGSVAIGDLIVNIRLDDDITEKLRGAIEVLDDVAKKL